MVAVVAEPQYLQGGGIRIRCTFRVWREGSTTAIDDVRRRTLLAKAIPYLVAAYWEAGARLNPATIVTRVVEEYKDLGEEMGRERDRLRSILIDLNRLNVAFENGKMSFDLDRTTALDLLATYLRMAFAKDGGALAVFTVLPAQLPGGQNYDAEFKLADHSIYARLLFRSPTEDEISSYLAEAQRIAPSEYWLFSLKEDNVDTRLQPVFVGENKVAFGRLRCVPLLSVLAEMLGNRYRVSATPKVHSAKVMLERLVG